MKLRSGVLAGLLLLGLACPYAYAADEYPSRQIKIIVPFPAGAGPDQVARLLGQRLQEELGQTVVIENRSGALGSLGAQEVARSTPDGYTLLMGTNTTQASNVSMLKNLPYDPAKDFSPIIRTITTAMVLLVKPDFPARDLKQFMDYSKTHPNMTAGYGSGASQISNAQLQSRGGMSLISASYRGVPLAVTDVIAGVIDLAFADFSVAIPQMQGGTLRGIGVTSPKRNELTPTSGIRDIREIRRSMSQQAPFMLPVTNRTMRSAQAVNTASAGQISAAGKRRRSSASSAALITADPP